MGCCEGQDSQRIQEDQENPMKDPNLREEIVEKSQKPQKDDMQIFTPDELQFIETVQKIQSSNSLTNQLYEDRGPYDYSQNPDDGIQRELRDQTEIENGGIYYGFWRTNTNIRDGIGLMIWPDGSRYDGNWSENRASGQGRLIHADGDVYEGEWLNDKAHGEGTYSHANGAYYKGDWVDDK